jgi:uncharacterized protein YbbC (DUF1343 family)
MQDIGSRSYTYITTLKNCMEKAAESKTEFIVLDRPNPITGVLIEGPVLKPEFISDIGCAAIPYLHGMTVGELALYFNGELKIKCNLKVIKMEGWKREMSWQDTGLPWVPTSPHIPEPDTPWYYPITGILGETPAVSVGVGYTLPFQIVGAPYINSEKFAQVLNEKKLPGVYFQPFYFQPHYHYFKDRLCSGVRIVINDRRKIEPVATGYYIMSVLIEMYPEEFNFQNKDMKKRISIFDKANGTDSIRIMLETGVPVEKITESYRQDVEEFRQKRKQYLLYR